MFTRVSAATLAAAIGLVACRGEVEGATPRIAIVMCEDTYASSPLAAQSSSQAAVGLAGLVGAPYDTLLLDELLATAEPPYTSIWFSWCLELGDSRYAALVELLTDYVGGGGNVFMDGPIGVFTPEPDSTFRGMSELAAILKVDDAGWYPLAGYRVTANDVDHTIAARVGAVLDPELSQGLHGGTQVVELADPGDPDGAVLLDLTHPGDPIRYPFLVAAQTQAGGRVVAVSRYGSFVGAATSFRNGDPSGFYDNRVLPYMIAALHWLEHRDDEPIAGLQLSHAPMTAIGRLDGDWSDEVGPTRDTLEYLGELAADTGLTTAYGIVSSFVSAPDWQHYEVLAKELEAVGGAVGSHSHTHDPLMSSNLTDAQWKIEVADSIDMVRARLNMGPAATRVFINPGGTIEPADYGRFFADVDLFMTHGFETAVPYASGVVDFGLPPGVEPLVVINNVPAPDFQWLYSSSWLYTVDQAADNQARILDYYQFTVGRGVLYNQMWHDYSIGGNSPPLHFPDAPTVLPLFEVNRAHFERNPVYMPSVKELVGKFHIQSKAVHSSSRSGDLVLVTIDYTAVPPHYRPHAAGMGLRIEGGGIAAVVVDGVPHPAFSDDTVMLPAPSGVTQTVIVALGAPAPYPRLRFASKPIAEISRSGATLTWSWSEPGLHRKFCVDGPEGTILLGIDRYARRSAGSVCGQVRAGSTTTQLSTTVIDAGALVIDEADRPIVNATLAGKRVVLAVADGPAATLRLRTPKAPLAVTVDSTPVPVQYQADGWELHAPPGASTVVIELDDGWARPVVAGAGDGEEGCVDCGKGPTVSGCRASRPGGIEALPLLLLLPFCRRRSGADRTCGC